MPKGIYVRTKPSYVRTPKIRELMRKKSLGHKVTVETRKKISESVKPISRILAEDPSWLKKVSKSTKKAMRRPDVRKRHLKGIANSERLYSGFEKGLSIEKTRFAETLKKILLRIGFVQEHLVSRGKGNGSGGAYRLDFAHVEGKINVECDGPYHRLTHKKEKDKIRDQFLKSRGWKVIRVKHD